jgi:hypothetical protein
VIWDSGTVFVLGAGFTKAFLPQAPLLIDDYGGDELKQKFARFPEVLALLEMELALPDHRPGWINLERLMTRLAGGMPYDFRTGADKPLAMLLSAIKQAFVRRLSEAKRSDSSIPGDLWLFAGHCVQNRINCVTFNYDDLLDEALWKSLRRYDPRSAWSPDWGYGFPCRISESCVTGPPSIPGGPGPVLLLKLHGSVNWRIPLGHPRPYAVEAITHHETWFEYFDRQRIPLDDLEQFLETDPFLVPPVLTKTDPVEQPLLRLTWSLAIKALQRAKRVVFIGYSLPLTDIAAGFLFREGLSHLTSAATITVVDFAGDEKEKEQKLARLLAAYQNVFPWIKPEQFEFRGGANWIRDNLTEWLYDSQGNPIAFNALGHIVSRTGRFIGTARSYAPDRLEVWHGSYKGEIVEKNRFLHVDAPPTEDRGGGEPPPLPGVPPIPDAIEPRGLPSGYQDVDLAERGPSGGVE